MKKFIFNIIKAIVKLVYPRVEFVGEIPDEPVIFVGNHAHMHSPIIFELYPPVKLRTWCAGALFNIRTAPSYAYTDFWSMKPVLTRPFYKLLSYVIAPLCVIVFNSASTIGVFRDNRIITTFRKTVETLSAGESVVIFPECLEKHNNIVYSFQTHFVDIAKLYYKRTGKKVKFVPVYVAPDLKKVYLGKGVEFSPDTEIDSSRIEICNYLMDAITDIARNLPEHTVVPYENIPRKFYPTNKKGQVDEKTDG